MEDHRLPKIMLYGQISNAPRPVGRPLLRYKDKLKENLVRLKMSKPDWEQLALQRTEWRASCHQHVTNFEARRLKKMTQDREERKNPQSTQPSHGFVCNICSKTCKSKAGLASHQRTHDPPTTNNEADVSRTCRICNKICKNERGLVVHLRVHSR